ncbi:MAG: putative F420-dependent oxidoreductase, Rv2161c family [Actinomycetia bacterium]|nr:putative F420-dependent oxidoreductase, Rv2161c family [Actinomycetes bacterium]
MQTSLTVSGFQRLFGSDPSVIVDLARVAETAGFDQLLLPDHVAIGPHTDRYPFGPVFPDPATEPWFEPMTLLSAMAMVTTRIRLGTGILIAPLRPAALLAKTAATLDQISGGRLDLGIGSGWQREEFDAVGVPFESRVARMDDTLRACRALWTQPPPVTFRSATVELADIWSLPQPVQAGGIPLWFGGGANPAVARRIAELGVGWMPINLVEAPALAQGVATIRAAFTAAGRDPLTLRVRVGIPVVTRADGSVDVEATTAPVAELEAAGATMVSVGLGRSLKDPEAVGDFLTQIGSAFAT